MNIHQLLDEFAISFGGIYGESMKFFNRDAQSEPIKENIESLPDIFSNCRVIATDSPYNRSRKEYFNAIGFLRNFTRILAVSAVLIEKLVQAAAGLDVKRITVSGMSLGGWIANIHHAYFNTAGQYRPVFAAGAPDSLFLDSAYSKMTSFRKLTDSSLLREVLNFEEDFRLSGNDNVFPLLAVYDRYIVLGRQRAVYDDHNISLIEKGHITGSADRKMIARFLGESLVSREANNIK